jgi:hypothetical protein
MFKTTALLLILLWLLAMAAGVFLNGRIHGLLYVAVVMVLMRLVHSKYV